MKVIQETDTTALLADKVRIFPYYNKSGIPHLKEKMDSWQDLQVSQYSTDHFNTIWP